MHRPQAETSFMERITDLDRSIRDDVEEAHRSSDKLGKVRALRRAARNLVLRETYNTDLRVIRPSGTVPCHESRAGGCDGRGSG
jgi:hypothetical protein